MDPRWIAIPLFSDEVAPRFCFARWMLLIEVEDGAVIEREQLDVEGFGWGGRLYLLSQRQVTMLVCGGFNRRYLHLAEALGIFVSWGHTGPVEPMIKKLCAGDLPLAPKENIPGSGCGLRQGRGRGRGQRQKQRQGHPRSTTNESIPKRRNR